MSDKGISKLVRFANKLQLAFFIYIFIYIADGRGALSRSLVLEILTSAKANDDDDINGESALSHILSALSVHH